MTKNNDLGTFAQFVTINAVSNSVSMSVNSIATNTFTIGTGTYFTVNGTVGIGTSSPVTQSKLTTAGSISVTASDGDWSSGGNRAFMDFAGPARFGSARGGGSATSGVLIISDGVTGIGVDTSGRITMPYQPIFYAYGGSSQSYSGSMAATILQLPFQSTLGSRSSAYNASTYRFTAPIAGTYMFMMKYAITGTATGPESVLFINGSSQQYGAIQYSSAGYCTAVSFHIWQCNAGDYAEYRIMNNNSTSFTVDTSRSVFAGWLMG